MLTVQHVGLGFHFALVAVLIKPSARFMIAPASSKESCRTEYKSARGGMFGSLEPGHECADCRRKSTRPYFLEHVRNILTCTTRRSFSRTWIAV